MEFLLFVLSGTMSAWGLPIQGNIRKTDDHPTKSGVIGFIAACLGITREMAVEFTQLTHIGFACREDRPGSQYLDYHTVQVGPGIVSERFYLIDAIFTICIWTDKKSTYPLKDICKALKDPAYTPFLGRKCCPLNIPPTPLIINAEDLSGAFQQYKPPELLNTLLKEQRKNRIFWEGDDQSIEVEKSYPRFDQPYNIRQYRSRIEKMGWKGVQDV